MMEEIVLETLDLLKPLLTNDPFLSNMDHAKLLLHPPIRYVYDLIMAISLSFPTLRKSLTPTDRNRNLALKNEATQREFFQKIAGFVQANDSGGPGGTPSVSSPFDVDVFLKGKGAKQTNFLLQKLAKMSAKSNTEVRHSNSTGISNSGSFAILADAKKSSRNFVGNILRPKSITLGTSISKGTEGREKRTALVEVEAAMPKAASACSFRQQARKTSKVPSLFPSSVEMAPTTNSHPLPSLMNNFSTHEDELPDEDFSLPTPEFTTHPENSECEPVSAENFENLLRDMRELADSIKGLKLQNSSILKELTSADQTMRATSRTLKVLDTYSSIKDNIKYPSTMEYSNHFVS